MGQNEGCQSGDFVRKPTPKNGSKVKFQYSWDKRIVVGIQASPLSQAININYDIRSMTQFLLGTHVVYFIAFVSH